MDFFLEDDRPEDSSWMLIPTSEVLSFPDVSFDGLKFIQVEADAWIDGALGQAHSGEDEVFVGISGNVRLEGGTLYLGDTAIASFNSKVRLEEGANGMLLTDV